MPGIFSDILSSTSLISLSFVLASVIIALAPLLSRARKGVVSFLFHNIKILIGLLPPRKKVWGTIYDSNTKRPIPFAKVQLLDQNRRVLETRIADTDGRYGFLTTPESLSSSAREVALLVNASGYIFPSRQSASIDTFVYNNLYYGDHIVLAPHTFVNFDIPMDPERSVKEKSSGTAPSIALGASVAVTADVGFWVGLLAVPAHFLFFPNPFTFGVLCLFLGTASLRVFGITQHPFGVIMDTHTGKPLPYALVTLSDAHGKRVGFSVSDEQGRYFLSVPRGTYVLAGVTPANIQPTRQIQQTMKAPKGWLTERIHI